MRIWLSQNVIDEMLDMGRSFAPLEVGGVLLGWRNGEDRTITGVIGPGPAALHGRQVFVPDHKWQVDQIHRAFDESAGDLDYLGDWHTHPNGPALMSAADDRTLRRIGGKVANPIMIIVDPSRAVGNVGAWTLLRSRWFRRSIDLVEVLPFYPNASWPARILR